MKKFVIALLCVSLIVSGAVVFAACSKNTDTQNNNNIESGAWAKAASHEASDELKELFNKLDMDGATYTPVALLETQIVAGTNYKVLCKVEPVVQNPVAKYAIVTLYENTEGVAELTQVLESEAEAPVSEEGMTGAWEENASLTVTNEADAALKKACETLTGAEYTPVALLATQVVAGTNYSILCEAKASVKELNSAEYYTLVHVYEDLDGNATITETYDFTNAE